MVRVVECIALPGNVREYHSEEMTFELGLNGREG